MTRRLFENLVVSAGGRRRGRGGFGLPASLGIHAALLGAAIVLPALGPVELVPEAGARPLPLPATVVRVAPPAVRDPIAVPSRGARRRGGPIAPVRDAPRPAPLDFSASRLPEPDDVLAPASGCEGPECSTGPGNLPPGFLPSDGAGGDDPGPRAVRATVDVAPPVKIRDVLPVYPELAKRAGVEGIVIIECTIDPRGRIAGARVLRGNPLLDASALDAVQQWLYRPTLLNGSPVSVVMTVTVRFTLEKPR